MRRLVHDDVVRQAGVDAVAARAVEPAEDEAFVRAGVEGIGVEHAVRRHLDLVAVERPADAPAQRELEARQRLHHQRVDVLRVEARIVEQPPVPFPPRIRLVPLVGQLVRAVVVAAAAVVVDHLQAVADRAGQQVFRRDVQLRHQDAAAAHEARILRDDRHSPRRRHRRTGRRFRLATALRSRCRHVVPRWCRRSLHITKAVQRGSENAPPV